MSIRSSLPFAIVTPLATACISRRKLSVTRMSSCCNPSGFTANSRRILSVATTNCCRVSACDASVSSRIVSSNCFSSISPSLPLIPNPRQPSRRYVGHLIPVVRDDVEEPEPRVGHVLEVEDVEGAGALVEAVTGLGRIEGEPGAEDQTDGGR